MGIPRLTSFMRQHFTGWKEEVIKGCLVIDGDALSYHLYNDFDWLHGGEYLEYREHAIKFFRALQSSGIEPIVVFDGTDFTGRKFNTLVERSLDRAKELISQFRHLTQCQQPSSLEPTQSKPTQHGKVILPLHAKIVLSNVLSDLSIKYVVVDGDADEDVAKVANFHSCHVLSNDSDFYMYSLKGGFIRMNDFKWSTKPIRADVYYMKAMLNQFKLRDESLRFIIPAVLGNDFLSAIEPIEPTDGHRHRVFYRHMKQVTSPTEAKCHPTKPVVTFSSHYDNIQDFIVRISTIDNQYLNTAKKKILQGNCIEAKKMYDIQEVSTLESFHKSTELRLSGKHDIPKWIMDEYRQMHLDGRLMFIAVCKKRILPVVAEDPKRPTSFCLSLPLRQAAYSILGLEFAIEKTPLELETDQSGVDILSCKIICDGQIITLDVVPTLELSTKKKIIYFFLHSNFDLIEQLSENWRLVTASVVFWAEKAKIPSSVIKVLLLTFVICSTASNMIAKVYEGINMNEDFVRSQRWLDSLHSFTQWQCSYNDAGSLNSVLQLPLQFSSLGHLFSGKFTLRLYFLSLSSDVSSVSAKLPIKSKELYHQLLTTVLSHRSIDSIHSSSDSTLTVSSDGLCKPKAKDYIYKIK